MTWLDSHACLCRDNRDGLSGNTISIEFVKVEYFPEVKDEPMFSINSPEKRLANLAKTNNIEIQARVSPGFEGGLLDLLLLFTSDPFNKSYARCLD